MSKNRKRKQAAERKDQYTRSLETNLQKAQEDAAEANQRAAVLEIALDHLAQKLGPSHAWVLELEEMGVKIK